MCVLLSDFCGIVYMFLMNVIFLLLYFYFLKCLCKMCFVIFVCRVSFFKCCEMKMVYSYRFRLGILRSCVVKVMVILFVNVFMFLFFSILIVFKMLNRC